MSGPIDSFEAGEILASLVDKNLVVTEEDNGQTRYRLLETVRQYGRDRLFESGEGEAVRDRHRGFYLTLAEEAEPQLTGLEQAAWLERLESDHDNLRSVLELRNDAEALRLAGALWRFWSVRGHLVEGRERVGIVLSGDESGCRTAARAKALNGAGGLAHFQDDNGAARTLFEESLSVFREIGDEVGIAGSLNNMGNSYSRQGDLGPAREFYEESLSLYRELGDKRGIAVTLNNLGGIARAHSDQKSALALYEESLTLRREVGDRRGIADSLGDLGIIAKERGDYESARALFEESLTIRREVGDRPGIGVMLLELGIVAQQRGDFGSSRELHEQSLAILRKIGLPFFIGHSLQAFAALWLSKGEAARAARLWSAVEVMRVQSGSPLSPNDRIRHDVQLADARAALGEEAFASAWQEGRALTMEQAIELALDIAPTSGSKIDI
jgi:tetratricopeptide (TPR) repeat protein